MNCLLRPTMHSTSSSTPEYIPTTAFAPAMW
jgi:hypothetical protein